MNGIDIPIITAIVTGVVGAFEGGKKLMRRNGRAGAFTAPDREKLIELHQSSRLLLQEEKLQTTILSEMRTSLAVMAANGD